MQHFCGNINLPDGVALTDELVQNVFFILMCSEVKIPIQIVGPPGCSKTLAMSIALTQSSRVPFTTMMETRYQCNPNSSDTEIENVFKRAEIRQDKNEYKRSVVFFDEGGLPREEEAALKVIHEPLDHPKVSCVILTNTALDAAKSNRTLILPHQSVYAHYSYKQDGQKNRGDDKERIRRLSQLIMGVLYNRGQAQGTLQYKITEGLAQSFISANEYSHSTKKNLFNQRDFVYFLRSLKKRCAREGGNNLNITSEALLGALRRNFSGIPHEDFVGLARMFLRNLDMRVSEEILLEDNTISSIRDAISKDPKNIEEQSREDPNTSDFRFVMVIDPTDNESAVSLLKELNVVDECDVIRVGRFPDDRKSAAMNSVLARMKVAITQGKTVLLVNSSELDSCFYDVLNRYFKVFTDTSSGRKRFLAQVGIGSHSCATVVDPEFGVIVHVPRSQLGNVPLPYLNRFEKYLLSFDQAIHDFVTKNLPPSSRNQFENLQREVLNFSQEMQKSSCGGFLYGCRYGQTELSLLLQVAKQTKLNDGKITIPFADAFAPDTAGDALLTDTQLLQLQARRLNFHLLQLAPPAALFLAQNLPKAYAKNYLLQQDHFNITSFVRKLIYNEPKERTNKWIIYTRAVPDLTLRTSAETVLKHISGNMSNAECAMLHLHTFASDSACVEELKKLQNKRLLVISADMRNCTQSQVSI